ncbi:MAG: amidohydrolase family protein [Actinomycetota bacterium]
MTAGTSSPPPPSWVLANGRLPDGSAVDVTVDGATGTVAAVEDHDPGTLGKAEVDLQGWLVLPSMVEPHAHLDKALTAELVPNPAGDLQGAIDGWIAASSEGRLTYEGTVTRAVDAMERLVVHGVTAVRTHVNVNAGGGAEPVKAVKEAVALMGDALDVQLVALCGAPLTGSEGASTRAALAEVLEVGVDFVGGCPHLDPDGVGVIDTALAAATEAGIGVDLHVDEMLDPSVLTLRDLARRVEETGFDDLVAASHCVTLGMQPTEVQSEVATAVAAADIAVFPLPQTNLFLQGRDHPTGTPRGLTAVRALQDAGALVAAGADNVQDPFNLVGRSDPLETAALMVMAGHQLPDAAYDMVSVNGRAALGLAPAGVEVGAVADLVAIDAPSIRGAIADAPMSRRVFRRGRLVAAADQQLTVHRRRA